MVDTALKPRGWGAIQRRNERHPRFRPPCPSGGAAGQHDVHVPQPSPRNLGTQDSLGLHPTDFRPSGLAQKTSKLFVIINIWSSQKVTKVQKLRERANQTAVKGNTKNEWLATLAAEGTPTQSPSYPQNREFEWSCQQVDLALYVGENQRCWSNLCENVLESASGFCQVRILHCPFSILFRDPFPEGLT